MSAPTRPRSPLAWWQVAPPEQAGSGPGRRRIGAIASVASLSTYAVWLVLIGYVVLALGTLVEMWHPVQRYAIGFSTHQSACGILRGASCTRSL